MREFEFSARTQDGELIRDFIRANNEKHARKLILAKHAALLKLNEVASQERRIKVPRQDVVFWLRQFATLLNAGVSMVQSLSLSCGDENQKLSEAMHVVSYDVQQGVSLSVALNRNTDFLTPTEIALIRAGEESGRLALVLLQLSDDLDRESRWRQRILSAATYPIFVLLFGAALFWLFVTWVIPAMSAVLEQLGVDLPWLTRLTIGFSELVGNKLNLALLSLLCAGLYFAGQWLWKRFRSEIEPWFFRGLEAIPYIGTVFSRLEQSRLLVSFGAMLNSGLHINEIVLLLRHIPKHPDRRRALSQVYEQVMSGTATSRAFAESRLFEPVVTHVLIAGEEVGELGLMARHSARILELELEQDTETLIVVMEPLLMTLIGGVAFFFIIAAFLPLVQVLGSFVQG